MTEKLRPTNEHIANDSNALLVSNRGSPVSLSKLPGTLVDVAKETPASKTATTEQDSDVPLSHSLASLTRQLCDSLKILP